MNEYFYHNWPILVVIVVILISMGISNWIVNVNFPDKGLEFKVEEMIAFKPVKEKSGPEISIFVDGEPVKDAFLTTVVVRNTGAYAIQRDDYEEPIQFHMLNAARIVQASYVLDPEYINADLTFSENQAVLSPALLNPRDRITVQLFTIGVKPELGVDARVEGVHTIIRDDALVAPYWGEVGWIHYLIYILTLFNLLLVALLMKANSGTRYLVMHKSAGCALLGSLALVSLYTYFSLMADHAMTVFASKLLLLGVSLLALLGAWQAMRVSEKG